jgi:hypothetical protein
MVERPVNARSLSYDLNCVNALHGSSPWVQRLDRAANHGSGSMVELMHLRPFWANRLERALLVRLQASARPGRVGVEVAGPPAAHTALAFAFV